ncbi:MAG TPA: hypothetical protein VHJ34_09530 [Actinomycetota bacterium]|nr:hypothetical protein [Actinomycetota bacterium]
MHDDVRTLIVDAAERVEPPAPDVGAVRDRARRAVVRSTLAGAVVVVLIAATTWAVDVSGLVQSVGPAGGERISTLSSRPVEVMTLDDERRARDDLIVVTPRGTIRRRLPGNVAARWELQKPVTTPDLEHLDTDCVKWRDAASEARYCVYRYDVLNEVDRKEDYRTVFVQGWSRGRASGLGTVRLALSLDMTGGRSANTGEIVHWWETGVIDGGGCTNLGGNGRMPWAIDVPPVEVCGDYYGLDSVGERHVRVRWTGDAPAGERVHLRMEAEWTFGVSDHMGHQDYAASLRVEHRAP